MVVITICNTKGGVGKSTIACFLAVEAAKEKRRVLLIDADKQCSSIKFRNLRARNEELDDLAAVSLPQSATLHKDVKKLDNSFDIVFIDVGAKDSELLRSGVVAADYVIVPVKATQFDLWASEDTMQILREISIYKPVQAKIVFNMANPNVKKETGEADEALEVMRIDRFNTVLAQRIGYCRPISEGMSATEYDPGSKASQEISELWKEVKQWLN